MNLPQLFRVFVLLVGFPWSPFVSGQETTAPQEQIFSGPQVGESLARFGVRGVFDEDAGKELDFVSQADGKPIVLIFVHDVTRPSIAMTRILSEYTVSRAQDGLVTGVVWLDDDATSAENQLKRIRHALTDKAPIGISVDGQEGPGSYGLNRNVMLTILVGNEGKVTGNFALIQPSLQVDLPKVLESIVAVVGGDMPKLEELTGMREMMQARMAPGNAPDMRPLLAPLIRRNASIEAVDQAAKVVEERAAVDEAVRNELGRIANTIVGAGKLENYGTARAQEFLAKWAKEYGQPNQERNAGERNTVENNTVEEAADSETAENEPKPTDNAEDQSGQSEKRP